MDRHEEMEAQLAQRLEEALRHSEARFRPIAKGLTEMVMACDMDRLTFVNAAAQSALTHATNVA